MHRSCPLLFRKNNFFKIVSVFGDAVSKVATWLPSYTHTEQYTGDEIANTSWPKTELLQLTTVLSAIHFVDFVTQKMAPPSGIHQLGFSLMKIKPDTTSSFPPIETIAQCWQIGITPITVKFISSSTFLKVYICCRAAKANIVLIPQQGQIKRF